MKYSEAKQVLEQQEKAKAVLDGYKKIASAHEAHGFNSRRAFIKALQEIDRAEKKPGRGQRGLSPDIIDKIKSLKSQGKSNAEISRTTGVSPLTVAKYVKGEAGKAAAAKPKGAAKPKAAKGKTGGGRGVASETVAQIKKLKSEGKSNAEISRTTGVGPITVAKYVKGQKNAAKAAPRKKPVTAKKK